ncbi:hypothetical protein OVA03_08795 [Asticcacaulis sp. SL142]|uniref:hypothetical protein n=1 Tax=Asticcacaulis sp. SL142 TaxID=2995155 RepID=UPI00226CC832|nr:hypothetical protein [Asticcacaulis sp. SL142]WAC46816.1 hypothetical protein OVA03_08795 [Asticcacaulis sp. SL142]
MILLSLGAVTLSQLISETDCQPIRPPLPQASHLSRSHIAPVNVLWPYEPGLEDGESASDLT